MADEPAIEGELDDAELDPASRSLLLVGAGSLAWQAGRGKDALQWLERGVAAAVADGHLPGRQSGLLTMAGVLIDQGRLGGARAAIAESYETVPSADSVSWLRFEAGRLELSQGHLGHAEAHITRAIELVEPSGSAVSQVWNHEILALIRLAQGRLDSAGSAARRALDIARGLEATRFGATPLAVLGRVELARGDLDRAAEAAARSLTLADRSGIPFDRATAWLLQGEVASARRDGEVVAQAREVVAGLLTGMDMQPQAAMAVRLAAL